MAPSASSQYVSNPPQPVTGLIDGNYNLTDNYVSNTGWTNIPANSPNGTERCWFQIDFAQPIQFESLKLVEGLIWSNNFYRRFITNANLYRSSDGIAFELIKEIRGNPTYAQPTLVSYYP